ncbi:MAG: ComEA family DNA-binding protein [Gammaproteobacteria bacterium]
MFKRSFLAALLIGALTVSGGAFAKDQNTPVNINKADTKALSSIHGIGPKKAQAIVDYRKSHGNFKSVDDLTKVKGISAASLAKISADLIVDQQK